MKLRNRHERLRLQRLIEQVATDVYRLRERGLMLHIEQLEAPGRLPSTIRVWANLHFLPQGSPFCCTEPDCHLFYLPWIFGHHVDPADSLEAHLRRRLGLRQEIRVAFGPVHRVIHPGVRVDRADEITEVPADVNEKDQMGRTAACGGPQRADMWSKSRVCWKPGRTPRSPAQLAKRCSKWPARVDSATE